jgi:hypothetical protein
MEATPSRDSEPPESPTVSAHGPSPERTVFTEEGNPDAWIATDTLVDLKN